MLGKYQNKYWHKRAWTTNATSNLEVVGNPAYRCSNSSPRYTWEPLCHLRMQFENFLRFQILDEHNASLICIRECNPLYALYLLLFYKYIVQPCILSISPLQGSRNEYVFLHCYKYMRLYGAYFILQKYKENTNYWSFCWKKLHANLKFNRN